MRIINYDANYRYNVPIYGGAADIASGALIKPGVTAGTDFGAAIVAASGANSTELNPDKLGILKDELDYSADGETLGDGTNFVTKEVEPISAWRVCRMEFSQASADLIECTQAVSTATMTVTSMEDNIDASFIYVVSGTGAGQMNFLTAAASGSFTLKAAFGTNLDTTSKFIKILRRFHPWMALNAGTTLGTGSKISSGAAQGGTRCRVLDIFIRRSGGSQLEQLNPEIHDDLTGLNSLTGLKFFADVIMIDTVPNEL